MVREASRSNIVGVLHCYTGSHALAYAALESGWYISFSGIVTFKKWLDDDLLRLVPDDRLLVESDSPYLAPVPDRGKRNEPAWVARTVERVAMSRGATPEAIGELSVVNAARFFSFSAA
jgi:TatD DNase family protein